MFKKILNSGKFHKLKKISNDFLLIFNDFLFYFVIRIFYLLSLKNKNEKFLIISGADSSHFKSLCQLINSLKIYCKNDYITIYDLGLTSSEKEFLVTKFKGISLKEFNFSKYPEHVNIKLKDSGAYAWKPIIIFEEYINSDSPIFWMDGGNKVTKDIKYLKFYISKKYFYSPYSSGNIIRWTHKNTIHKLDVQNKLFRKRNLNAAILGVKKNPIVTELLHKWYENSLNSDVIIPEGSNKSNHRWDQSILSILFYQIFNFKFKLKTYKFWGIKIHQDID